MSRFVLLRHDCPADYRDGPHWDWMLERADDDAEHRLVTWSLLDLPAAWSALLGLPPTGGESVEATRLVDHRAAYLDYEGPVSGGRGEVRRLAGGAIEWVESTVDRVVVRIEPPSPLAGVVTLEREADSAWRLEWAASISGRKSHGNSR